MTREEYNNLTDEQRYDYILKLEDEKKVDDKALEKVLDSLKKTTVEDRLILLDTEYKENGLMLRASDIITAQSTPEGTTIVTTKQIEMGKEKTYMVQDNPALIANQIKGIS